MAIPAEPSILESLVAEIRGRLGEDLVGLYLYGSAVTGGFDPGVSDVDLMAVTAPEVEDLDLAGLEAMHLDLVRRNPDWKDRIDVTYIGRPTLAAFRSNAGRLAVISPGEPFHVVGDVADWLLTWYQVQQTAVPLDGPHQGELIPAISDPEFVAAIARHAQTFRNRVYAEPSFGARAYAVLTMCRALRTVLTDTHSSKQDAAAWVRERMPEWAWLIDEALRTRLSRGKTGFADEHTRAEAERFIELVTDEIRDYLGEAP
jgi:Aminoglycoside adenylyltransferase, C-terminal domain/Nucleotidyltransferase domain